MKEYLIKEYKNIKGQDYEVRMYYNKDARLRGYYLAINPVELRDNCVVTKVTFGADERELYNIVLQVSRKSKKNEQQAIELAKPLIEEHFCKLEKKETII